MKKYIISFSLTGVLVGYASSGNAANYPLEFADFFVPATESVEVVIEGLPYSEDIVANVSYDKFQVLDSKQSGAALLKFLERHRLSNEAVKGIVSQLKNGVPSNPGCEQSLRTCIPELTASQASYVFDYDAKLLRIFVSSDMFDSFSGEKEYYTPIETYSSLVNWSNAYVYASEYGQSINWVNETTLGLPVGNISVHSQYNYSDSEREFDVNRALYSVEMNDYRAIVGYQDSHRQSFNSTDFLADSGDYSGVQVSIGSSANLLKGSQKALQRVHFFSPQGGQLEVYQGTRLLLSKVVGSGEQSVGYNELPFGVYTVTLRLKQGDSVLLEEVRQIVNTSDFSLPVGDVDYRVDVGHLEYESDNATQYHPKKRSYFRSLATYRPGESWLIGGGFTSNGENTQGTFGLKASLTQNTRLQYSVGLFDSGDLYQFGQLQMSALSFNFRAFEHNNLKSPDDLSQLLYGKDDFKEYGVGFFSNWLIGRTSLNYFHNETIGLNGANKNDNISLTWTRPLWGGDVSINSTYNKSQEGRESINTGISWSRRFGGATQGRLGVNFNKDNLHYSYADASHTFNGDNLSLTSRAGIKDYQDGEIIGEGSVSLMGQGDGFRYDAYAFVDTQDNHSVSGSISGSQMLSSRGAALSSERNSAFVELYPQWESSTNHGNEEFEVNYTALMNGQYWYDNFIPVGQPQVLKLPLYSQVSFNLDTESKNVDSEKVDDEFFVTPGRYYRLDNTIVPLESQVFVLNDMNGDVVHQARCIGEGCKSVEMLSDDGVVRLNYRADLPFKLVSDRRLCVFNEQLMGAAYIQAYCLPGLDNEGGQLVSDSPRIDAIKGNEPLVYIGKYESHAEIQSIVSRLNEVGLMSKSIEVGSVQYIYVQYQRIYTSAQRALLENLDAYVILDTINTKQIFTSR